MAMSKGILQSKTIWGALIGLAAKLTMGWFGIEITDDMQQELAIALLTIIGASGDILAIYGRIVAKVRIGPNSTVGALVCLLLLSGCAGMPCLDRVAITEIAITETIELAQIASDDGILNKDKVRKAIPLIRSANVLSDQALSWCGVEDPTALDYILQAERLIVEVETLIGE